MAKISESVDERSLADHIQESLPSISITTRPVVIVGVQRKVNIGNYENIDIYAAIALPVDVDVNGASQDHLTQVLQAACEYGFGLVSSETGRRYNAIIQKKEEDAATSR